MCMASYFPPGKVPLRERLLNGAELNPDGHGFAIVTADKQIITQKSMDGPWLVNEFMRKRILYPDGPAVFHSRIATSGQVDITGCHPFKVGQDNRTVLIHNGILFHPTESERSDTRIFAEDMLPRMGSLDKAKGRRRVEQWIGKGNKIVVLTVNPARRRNAYILNERMGIWTPDGEWHSNSDYEGRWWDNDEYVAYYSQGAGKPKTIRYGNSAFACEVCGSYDAVSLADSVCEVCNACNDCKMNIQHCMCYVPDTSRRAGQDAQLAAIGRADNGYWEKTPSGGWAYNS